MNANCHGKTSAAKRFKLVFKKTNDLKPGNGYWFYETALSLFEGSRRRQATGGLWRKSDAELVQAGQLRKGIVQTQAGHERKMRFPDAQNSAKQIINVEDKIAEIHLYKSLAPIRKTSGRFGFYTATQDKNKLPPNLLEKICKKEEKKKLQTQTTSHRPVEFFSKDIL